MTVSTTFDGLCAQIDYARPPEPIFPLSGQDVALVAQPLPPGTRTKTVPRVVWAVAVPLALLACAWGATVAIGLIGLIAVGVWSRWYTRGWRAEYRSRTAALKNAHEGYAAVTARVDALGPAGFAAVQHRLASLRREYTDELPALRRKAVEEVDRAAAGRQLQRHLAGCSISAAAIPGLGPARKTTLIQFGITDAATVSPGKVQALPGFGPGLTASVLAWRDACRASFRFDPQDPGIDSDRAQALQPLHERGRALEAALDDGLAELTRIGSCPAEVAVQLGQDVAVADRARAQAHLDLSVL